MCKTNSLPQKHTIDSSPGPVCFSLKFSSKNSRPYILITPVPSPCTPHYISIITLHTTLHQYHHPAHNITPVPSPCTPHYTSTITPVPSPCTLHYTSIIPSVYTPHYTIRLNKRISSINYVFNQH